jgi:hypothetical protein
VAREYFGLDEKGESVNAPNLFIPLVGLPVVAAICLGFFMRSLVNGGRGWPVWLVGMVVSCVLWGLVFSGTP